MSNYLSDKTKIKKKFLFGKGDREFIRVFRVKMFIYNLKTLSLKSIIFNIDIINELIKKNKWKLPGNVGQEIFNYLLKPKKPLIENSLKLFYENKNLINLSKIHLDQRNFRNLNNFDFLQYHLIKDLIISNFFPNLPDNLPSLHEDFENLTIENCYLRGTSADSLDKLLSNCNNLKYFKSHFIQIDEENSCKLINILNKFSKSLNHIEFEFTDFKEFKNSEFFGFLEKCENLKEFYMKTNLLLCLNIDSAGLMKSLRYSAEILTHLHISIKEISTDGIKELNNLLELCKHLENFSFGTDVIKLNDFELIINGLSLSSSNSLKHLEIQLFDITDINNEGWQKLSANLKRMRSMKHVSITITSDMKGGFQRLLDGLQSSTNSLISLQLIYSKVTEDDGLALSELLNKCKALKDINFSGMKNIRDNWAKIFKSLEKNVNLEKIKLAGIQLDKNGWFELSDLLKKLRNTHQLTLSNNKFSINDFKAILSGLRSSEKQLQDIEFSNCKLEEEQFTMLGEFIQNCSLLQTLDLTIMKIVGSGFERIIEGLENLTYFTNLFINPAYITSKQKSVLDKFHSSRI